MRLREVLVQKAVRHLGRLERLEVRVSGIDTGVSHRPDNPLSRRPESIARGVALYRSHRLINAARDRLIIPNLVHQPDRLVGRWRLGNSAASSPRACRSSRVTAWQRHNCPSTLTSRCRRSPTYRKGRPGSYRGPAGHERAPEKLLVDEAGEVRKVSSLRVCPQQCQPCATDFRRRNPD